MLLAIAPVSDESGTGMGIVGAAGGEGVLESRWSQALTLRQ